ncbi:transcription factor IIIA [Pelobates fuscus]|uniref:transcription factor IIIA n=1 Tax=Pelobates fuscus TaxID=191477 RepID=UPI002FE4D1BB
MASVMASSSRPIGEVFPGSVDAVRAMGESVVPAARMQYICSFQDCSKTYNKKWKLELHLCKHTGEKPFRCDHEGCEKAFASKYHLQRHMMTHTGEKNIKCDSEDCNIMFNSKANMKKHFNRAHVYTDQVYECDFPDCGLKFKKHNKLRMHQCTHTNELPFKCTFDGCNKCYASPSRLKRHAKVHAGYKCKKDETCEFVGKTWSDYIKHVSTCHAEPLICDVCNKKFKKKWFLNDHKVTHDKERKVYCCPRDGCDRTYTTAFNLRSHILSFHEEKRSFVCEHPDCGKTFVMKRSLERHEVVHDPEKRKLKERKPRPKRSLASRLSGYKPPKTTNPPEKSHSEMVMENPPQNAEINHGQLEQLTLK